MVLLKLVPLSLLERTKGVVIIEPFCRFTNLESEVELKKTARTMPMVLKKATRPLFDLTPIGRHVDIVVDIFDGSGAGSKPIYC